MMGTFDRGQFILVAGALAAILLGAVLQARRAPPPLEFAPAPQGALAPDSPGTSAPASGASGGASSAPTGPVAVHVAGAVKRPGVYDLDASQRVVDALQAAGGARQDADTDAINLAAHLTDGQQILVPKREAGARTAARPPVARTAPTRSMPSTAGGAKEPAEVIDLNNATEEELDSLPGIGPAIASRIVQYRAAHGRFQAPEELMEVSGIGPRKFEKLSTLITVQ